MNDRSFYFGIRKFPLCARCTGMYVALPIGMVFAILLSISPFIYLSLAAPLVLDGLLQLFTKYRSTNLRRFITGVLFGFSYGAIVVTLIAWFSRLLF